MRDATVEENRDVEGGNGRCLLKIDANDGGDDDVEGGHVRVKLRAGSFALRRKTKLLPDVTHGAVDGKNAGKMRDVTDMLNVDAGLRVPNVEHGAGENSLHHKRKQETPALKGRNYRVKRLKVFSDFFSMT